MLPFIKPHPLQIVSQNLRHDLLDMVYKNGGHIGGSLSSIDLMAALYFGNLFNFKKDHFIFFIDIFLFAFRSTFRFAYKTPLSHIFPSYKIDIECCV